MYQTRIFTLEELTEGFFKEPLVAFAPKDSAFFTEKQLKTPLGFVEVGFTSHGAEDFSIDFLNNNKKYYLHVGLSLHRGDKEHSFRRFLTITKSNIYNLPISVKDVTLEGIRLCKLQDNHAEFVGKNDTDPFIKYFVGNMIYRMWLRSWNSLKKEEQLKEMQEEGYNQCRREWEFSLLEFSKIYAGYSVRRSLIKC